MSIDQMLWHVNQAMEIALDHVKVPGSRSRLPGGLLKFMVLRLPWVKGAPTHPSFVPKATYDFAEQQERCLQLIDVLANRPLDGAWPVHPVFGPMTGREVSHFMAKHLDHHLRQFGV